MAFIPGATGVGFYNALEEGAKAEAAKLGDTFLYQGSPDFTPAAQTPVVNAVCAKHPKILLIAPTDPVALRPAIQTCMNAGVKVVTVDTSLTNTAGLVSAITSNNIQGGEAAAGVIAKALKGHGQVAVFSIDGTTTTQVERVQGLKKGLAHYPGISIVSSQFTGQPETVSETDTKAVMTSHPRSRRCSVRRKPMPKAPRRRCPPSETPASSPWWATTRTPPRCPCSRPAPSAPW